MVVSRNAGAIVFAEHQQSKGPLEAVLEEETTHLEERERTATTEAERHDLKSRIADLQGAKRAMRRNEH